MVLICIFLMINDIVGLFICLFAILYLVWWVVYSNLWPIFQNRLFLFLLLSLRVQYIFQILNASIIWAAISKYHRLGDLNSIYFLTVLETGSPNLRRWQHWFLLRSFSLACRWPATFLLCPHSLFSVHAYPWCLFFLLPGHQS